MDADWYEDPLDRFDGRFFDGEAWTAQVSAQGKLQIDPDFGHQPGASEFGRSVEAPAVAQISTRRPRRASTAAESPVRTVAVIDKALVQDRLPKPTSRSWMRWVAAALLVAVAAVVLAALFGNADNDAAVAEAADLSDEQEARVEDVEASGTDLEGDVTGAEELEVNAPGGPASDADTFDPSELLQVGSISVVNGVTVLDELESWHRQFAADRGVKLGADAGCWFGQIGDGIEQNVHCGPVGASAADEPLFDAVPIVFQDVDGGMAAQPVTDAVTIDAVLANPLSLVGDGESIAPTRGERAGD